MEGRGVAECTISFYSYYMELFLLILATPVDTNSTTTIAFRW